MPYLNLCKADVFFIVQEMCKTQITQFKQQLHPSHRVALAEYSHMSTHLPGFQSFSVFLHHFVLAKIATCSIRVNECIWEQMSATNRTSIPADFWSQLSKILLHPLATPIMASIDLPRIKATWQQVLHGGLAVFCVWQR